MRCKRCRQAKQRTLMFQFDQSCTKIQLAILEYQPALEGRSIINLQMSDTDAAFQDINTSVKVKPSAELLTNRGVIQQVIYLQYTKPKLNFFCTLKCVWIIFIVVNNSVIRD